MHSACHSSWLNRPTMLQGTTVHSSPCHASKHNDELRAPSLSPDSFRRASGPTPIATAKTNAHKMIGAVRISAIAVFAAPDPALFDKRITAQRRKQKKAPKWEPSNTSRR